MEIEKRINKCEEILNEKFPHAKLTFVGSGFEAVIFADGKYFYKVFDKWRSSNYPIFLDLIEKVQDSKRIVKLKDFLSVNEYHILIYDFFESTEYKGGYETDIKEFILECRKYGIIFTDVKPKNFRITQDGLKLVDIGWDVKPFNYKDFLFMVQRAYLMLKNYDRTDFKQLARLAIKNWEISELDGFITFFNDVYKSILELEKNNQISNPITLFNKDSLNEFIELKIPRKGKILEIEYNSDQSFLDDLKCTKSSNEIIIDITDTNLDDIKLESLVTKLKDKLSEIGVILLLIKNPYFYPFESQYPLTHIEQRLLYSGFKIEEIIETSYQNDKDGCFYSDYLIIKIKKMKINNHKVSMLIKTCYQDGEIIERQIRHIVKQCEYPESFYEKIVVVDSKESDFLRQYSTPKKEILFNALNKLRKEKIIDDYIIAPTDPEEIKQINLRWFKLETTETHSIKNIPVTPQVFAFEKMKGDYILQMDSDVIIGRHDRNHNYIKDMVKALEENEKALSVSFNIAHSPKSKLNKYSSPGLGGYVPEVRFCLIDKKRLLECRPFPNELIDNRLNLSWYRSIEQYQKKNDYISLRGGNPKSYYIHPPNTRKLKINEWFSIVDRVESGYIPEIQFDKFDLEGSESQWAIPKRNEPFIFIITGRNISTRKFYRCWQSVINQERINWAAIIIDDASESNIVEYIDLQIKEYKNKVTYIKNFKRMGVLQNIYKAIKLYCINPFSIIIILDADDMLLSKNVLDKINDLYLLGTDVTIGGMLRKDKGINNFIPNFNNPRNKRGGDVWVHLRTFRKYLFDNIKDEDFKINKDWIDKFTELTYMVPIIEMSKQPYHIKWPIYLYEPTQKRNEEHYIKNKQTIDLIKSKPKYNQFSLSDNLSIRPLGELLKILKETNILFIRHAETLNIKTPSNILRKKSLELSENGEKDCVLLGRNLPIKIDLIIVSNTKRTIKTAKLIIEGNNPQCKIEIIDDLRKIRKYKPNEWKELVEIQGYMNILEKWYRGKISEGIVISFGNYIENLIKQIKEKINKNNAKNILIITHDHIIRTLNYYFTKEIIKKIPYLYGFLIKKELL